MCPFGGGGKLLPSKAKGRYCRLFSATEQPLGTDDYDKLVQLGKSMRYNVEREGTLTPRVGFTYFGQFVGHDLSHDPSPLPTQSFVPETTPNYRTPYLNLEQVYGGGPAESPHLYEGPAGVEVFKIGRTRQGHYARDIPPENGIPRIADERNLDNVILRQLHVVFLKFHNEAVRQITLGTLLESTLRPNETVFEQARRVVQWHYQWIVRHDFLPRILHGSYWHSRRRLEPRSDGIGTFSIPVEFSLAAFRFGHSMVRKAYGLNCRRRRVELTELMELGRSRAPLPEDVMIEWGRFFEGLSRSGPVASSQYLDTSITDALHGMPRQTLELCVPIEGHGTTTNLPVRTLLRGARARLPSGQEVAAAVTKMGAISSDYALTPEQLTTDTSNASGSVLRETGLHKRTPLFYYILKEAELLSGGRTLGPVGSWIVGRTLETALSCDPHGYIRSAGQHWQLPLWRFPSGNDRPVNSLTSIIRLVGDTQLLPECREHVNRMLGRFHRSSAAMTSALS